MHSKVAATPENNGASPAPALHSISLNFSGPDLAKRCESPIKSSERMFTAKCEQFAKAVKLVLSRRIDHKTSGGLSETDAKEFEVRPKRSPLTDAVTTVMPVANSERLRRKPSISALGSPISSDDTIDPLHLLVIQTLL